eukprot:380046-Hanusia_phi.AAC.1
MYELPEETRFLGERDCKMIQALWQSAADVSAQRPGQEHACNAWFGRQILSSIGLELQHLDLDPKVMILPLLTVEEQL